MLRFLSSLSMVVLLAASGTACRKRQVQIPVAPAPAPAEAPTPPVPTQAPPTTPAPTTVPPPQNPPQQEKPSPLGPPATQAPQSPPALPPPQSQQPPPPRRTPQTGPGTQAPRLGDILTLDQQRQYNAAIDQSLARAQRSLESIANRQLTKEQHAVVSQVQGFIQQAQTTRKSNLTAARSLAERAEVLARDLAGSLR